jgi:DNA-binding CsgD family transcriptional regulator/ArsR family metal-binding transcriptional regulator
MSRFFSCKSCIQGKLKMNGVDHLERMDFSKSRDTLVLFSSGPFTGNDAEIACEANGARFQLSNDLSPLFPYINAVADHARLYEKPVYIRFVFEKRLCAFYAREGAFTPIGNMAQALEFLQKLFNFIEDISRKSESIIPSHKKFKPSSALDIYRLLPGSNCRICGYTTCMAFAAALSRQYTSIVNCPHLSRPMEERATYPVYDQLGNVVKTVSFNIDSDYLHKKVSLNEAQIQDLQSRLGSFEKDNDANFDAANSALPAPLSRREIEVLRLIAHGATNKEISADLQISQHTVKSHVIHIFNKIGVNDRVRASTWGVINGVMNKKHRQ